MTETIITACAILFGCGIIGDSIRKGCEWIAKSIMAGKDDRD